MTLAVRSKECIFQRYIYIYFCTCSFFCWILSGHDYSGETWEVIVDNYFHGNLRVGPRCHVSPQEIAGLFKGL